jgi:hypothetical protein
VGVLVSKQTSDRRSCVATENATWGYTRIQGALKNLGHSAGRSSIARILKAYGIPPSRQRPMAWRTFVRAHWSVLRIAGFSTSNAWTFRGLMTCYTSWIPGLVAACTCGRLNGTTGRCHPAPGHAAISEYVTHYHLERNHQGLGNTLITSTPARATGSIRLRPRLGGLLNYDERAA